jgi:sugar/nucleoside kinase (ribokinase family)
VGTQQSAAGRVLVVGDIMIDILVRAEGALVKGSDRRARIVLRQGGSAANQAVWLAHFGVGVDFVGRVGAADLAAQQALLRARGVTPWLAGDAERETGRLIALIDPDGERSFLTDRSANEELSLEDIAKAPVDEARAIHLSGYSFFAPTPRAAAIATMARAKASGIPVSIDPASASFLQEVGPQQFLSWTAGANMIFPNEDEAAILTGAGDAAEQMRLLAALYPVVAIKRGANGAQLAVGQKRWSLPAQAFHAVDTTGAGDAFIASFLANWLRGSGPERCLAEAIAAGSLATRTEGGRPEILGRASAASGVDDPSGEPLRSPDRHKFP